ncbi:YitT family protein [Paenibacillus antri]|uniref:YitT family protein n=1 Tax=Paenibacillus antri TaxID=2582848 RepID=A0A5R9G9N7_9BACL|nr:YitT family protein [Paenibacillus antri]TLS50098.1 YitT family protein [Paenibacillus antri]
MTYLFRRGRIAGAGRPLCIAAGCLLVSLGLIVLKHSGVVTGGTAGLTLTLSYMFDMPFALLFFIVNIPFYFVAAIRMGWNFTLSTMISVLSVTTMTAVDRWLPDFVLNMFVGTFIGSVLCGIGLTTLFVNRASLGGVNIIALFLQNRYNVNPGNVNFVFDTGIVLLGFYSVGALEGMLSIASVIIVSSIIGFYKKKIFVGNQLAGKPPRGTVAIKSSRGFS